MNSLTLKSYAKLNLFLSVVNKRKDSYHTLNTLFERIDLHDTIRLTVRRDTGVIVRSTSRAIPSGPGNLAWKSAVALQKYAGVRCGADIEIEKRIPVGAGMGGGSSNAAAVLSGLNRLWKTGLDTRQLVAIGRTIGADVPFFLYEVPFAYAEGVGDMVKPLPRLSHRRLWHVVAVPRVHVSTPYIYQQWDLLAPKVLKKHRLGLTIPKNDVKLIISELRKENTRNIPGEALFNALQFVTRKRYPSVDRLIRRIGNLGISTALMSGSGPTVFALMRTKKEASGIASRLSCESPNLRLYVAKTI